MDRKPTASPLPAIGRLLERPELEAYFPLVSRSLAVKAARELLAELRASAGGRLGVSEASSAFRMEEAEVARMLADRLEVLAAKRLQPVLNATGILLHTNLGRSPLDRGLWEEARALNEGYCNLEFDLATGERGSRGGLCRELAAELAGAEAAFIANNNAAALLLTLRALAGGREVLVSRGEAVQIGGGFRIPDILAVSGARLVEVGTTNVTTVEDYLSAVGPDTAMVLKVHSSNFAIRGFASSPGTSELAAALPSGLPLLVDQGSGAWRPGLPGELPFRRHIEEGASLVAFSGDKLLGGPQAGLIVGSRVLIDRLSKDPFARALRPGKAVLSLLEGTLLRRLAGGAGSIAAPEKEALADFGKRLQRRLPSGLARLVESQGAYGGGSSPDESFPSLAIRIKSGSADSLPTAHSLSAELRRGRPPLVALIREGCVELDLAGLLGEDPAFLALLLREALLRSGWKPGEEAAQGRSSAPPRKSS